MKYKKGNEKKKGTQRIKSAREKEKQIKDKGIKKERGGKIGRKEKAG